MVSANNGVVKISTGVDYDQPLGQRACKVTFDNFILDFWDNFPFPFLIDLGRPRWLFWSPQYRRLPQMAPNVGHNDR